MNINLELKTATVLMLMLLLAILLPEFAYAVSLEDQLTKANTLVTSKLKIYGITGSAIAGAIWAIFKGNVKLAGIIVVISVIMSLFFKWVEDGMTI